MKLRDVAKGTRAVKAVPFRLANAPEEVQADPGEPALEDPHTYQVGVRVLTGGEIADVLEKAQAAALAGGVKEWLDTHPLCRLHLMAHTLAVACVDNEKRDEPFFASADEIMASPEVGGDGIAYLFEQHGLWQDQCSIATKDLTVDQVIGILLSEAERPENAGESPFSRMRASTRESFLRITASLFLPLLTDRSRYGSTDDSSSSESSTSSEKPPAADEG